MMIDISSVSAFLFLTFFGAVTRAFLGLYKAYMDLPGFDVSQINWKRIVVELLASMFFGTFGMYILSEITQQMFGWKGVGLEVGALVAGFLGADFISIVTRRLGLSKGLQIKVVEEQAALAEFNERQVAALEYLKKHDKMTNKVYQKLNSTTRDVARWDLNQLVRKKKLKRFGKGKAVYYTLS